MRAVREAVAVAISVRMLSALLCAGAAGATVLIAQQGNAPQTGARGAAAGQAGRQGAAPRDTRPFNAREIGGVWSRNSNGFGGGGTCVDCGDRGYSLEWPEFTPDGQKAFDQNIPSYGREKDSADAVSYTHLTLPTILRV